MLVDFVELVLNAVIIYFLFCIVSTAIIAVGYLLFFIQALRQTLKEYRSSKDPNKGTEDNVVGFHRCAQCGSRAVE